ncbi:MAG: molecular chaperone TorD family protein [Actinomycetota bacterium]
MTVPSRERLISLFVEVLDYPGPGTAGALGELERLLAGPAPAAADIVARHRDAVTPLPLGRLQEMYTGAFDLDTLSDLDATVYPYVGHHLFGESYKRSAFLTELAGRFRAEGFEVERELPDHLVVILRYIVARPDGELAAELTVDAVIPARERMTGDLDEAGVATEPATGRQVYQLLLAALRIVLEVVPGPGGDATVPVAAAGPTPD